MSTAGAQGVKFDSSAVRPTISPNTRLICSFRVVAPRKGCSQRFVVLILATSFNVYGSVLAQVISDNSCQFTLPAIVIRNDCVHSSGFARNPVQIGSAFSTRLPYR